MSDPAVTQRKELDELISRLSAMPGVAKIAELLDRFEERRGVLIRAMVAFRASQGITQQEVARRMATSQPAVARLEAGLLDPRLSTLERYAAAIGYDLNFGIDP